MNNLNLLYNKTMYDKLGLPGFEDDLKKMISVLLGTEFDSGKDVCSLPDGLCNASFRMKTIYPGLLIGAGYAHGVSEDSDFKIGFSFDYVTGQPYIPGSTVKGVIKSFFKHEDAAKSIVFTKKAIKNCNEIDDAKKADIVKKFVEETFDEGKDTFFDAVIIKGDSSGKILGEDYLCPHSDPLKNPVPIRFLKILPGVELEFRFRLSEFRYEDIVISPESKSYIFTRILSTIGIGAKTNVGYGNLAAVKKDSNTDKEKPKAAAQPEKKNTGRGTLSGLDALKGMFE